MSTDTATTSERRTTRTARAKAIVVGVDGSPASRAAVDFAVAEARRRDAGLELLHAFDLPIYAADPLGAAYVPIDRDELAAAAGRVLGDELARIVAAAPELDVRTVSYQGSAGQMLVDASKDAAMIVVGAKHRSEFVDVMLGSVCHKVLHHARCPVVLVPPPHPQPGHTEHRKGRAS